MSALHIITCEYAPRAGGVGDYTRLVAGGLAAAGEEVHVWCRSSSEEGAGRASIETEARGVTVHRECGGFAPADLKRVGTLLDAERGPRRLLVQYVPHGFGYRSMNVALCAWLWARARRGDRVELMVHEPFLAFGEGGLRQQAAAVVHRLMTLTLLRAASRVWVSTPAWERAWRPYAVGRRVPFAWLPVPCTIPVAEDAAGAAAVRARYACGEGTRLIGHLGTYGRHVSEYLLRLAPALLGDAGEGAALLLMGRGGESVREEIVGRDARLAGRVHAAGYAEPRELSRQLAACDLLLQPYPDGVSSRRTSVMAGLAHGLAVVTTAGRLTEPLWEASGAVALAPAGDPEAIAGAVARLLADAAGRARLGARARALYRERFDLAHTVAALGRARDERDEAPELMPAKAKA